MYVCFFFILFFLFFFIFFYFLFFIMVWNYYFISARWLPPLRINKVKVKKIYDKRKLWTRTMSDCCRISCFLLRGFISSETLSTRQKWFVRNNSLAGYVLQSGCSSACVETFSTIDAAKFPINKKNLFISKSWQIAYPWRL